MSRAKRVKFDPLSIRAVFEKQKTISSTFSLAYEKFAQEISGVGIDNISMIEELSGRSMEVLLVHMIGLKGVECMKSTVRLIPKEIPQNERVQYVKNIVDSVLDGDIVLSDDAVIFLIKLFDDGVQYNVDETLHTLSKKSGTAYTSFLAPPTSACLNECCPRFGNLHSLHQHHLPITVSLFTLEGPKPGTKICLKCRECNTIYNYSSFGKKKTEGERFYNDVRDYVEVSDVTFCDRRLLRFYSLLR